MMVFFSKSFFLWISKHCSSIYSIRQTRSVCSSNESLYHRLYSRRRRWGQEIKSLQSATRVCCIGIKKEKKQIASVQKWKHLRFESRVNCEMKVLHAKNEQMTPYNVVMRTSLTDYYRLCLRFCFVQSTHKITTKALDENVYHWICVAASLSLSLGRRLTLRFQTIEEKSIVMRCTWL